MRLVYSWLRELVEVPDDVDRLATTLGLRGFEVASIEHRAEPVIDFEITANRPDCLSMLGLAREASAAYGLPLRMPDATMPPAPSAREGRVEGFDVTIEDPDLCPRYCAQVFQVQIGTSPAWLQQRLEAAGVRSISNVVDVTNYVMLEMGQPTHAFDLERLGGRQLRIRRARPGETLRTLDGVERALEPDMLVIADGRRAQAVGGVMGGADSEISAATTLMVLESAYFRPSSIRRTSKRLGLRTEASTRFERGADVNAAPAAIGRIASLLHQLGAATPLGATIDRYPAPLPPLTLTLRADRIARVLGEAVADSEIPARLEPLGFAVTEERGAEGGERTSSNVSRPEAATAPRSSPIAPRTWLVHVPSYRVDVQREIDLIEEVARHDGYHGLPATFPVLAAPQPAPDARTLRDRRIRHVLTAAGLSEAMTFAFTDHAAAMPFAGHVEPAAIANPLSEKYAVLRPSLLPGLIDAAAHNRRREQKDIRLFETGARFVADGEHRAVAAVLAGAAGAPHWSGGARAVDFFDVKGIVEALCRAFGIEIVTEPAERPYFVEGRSASIKGGNQALGELGQLAPKLLEARGFPGNEPVFGFEIDAGALGALEPRGDRRAEPLPRFPSILRDLSILVDDGLPAARVRGTIRAAAPSTLVQVTEFDRYRGKGVPDGRVSLSLRLTFRSPERTLTDAEVDDAMNGIVRALASEHGAMRR